MTMQATTEEYLLHEALATTGIALIDHNIPDEEVDNLVQFYAQFTDNYPDPEPETMLQMITNPKELDLLDYAADTQKEWHKYRTNHLQFAKPGGYTNRSYQAEVLTQNGFQIVEDPKEYYHFCPNSTAKIVKMHRDLDWGPVPKEVFVLNEQFNKIHYLARQAAAKTLHLLEIDHPEIMSRFVRPQDLLMSPLRLLFYHPAKLVDLKATGVIDPARVTKEAIQNAVSIAGTAMTMGALVVDIPEKKDAAPDMSGMGGGMGMM